MKAVAILLTKNSINAVVESLPFNGKGKFAYACLRVLYRGDWYYVSMNPDNPGTVDYEAQIMSAQTLLEKFEFETPANPRFWFPVEMREKVGDGL